ncbi:hypothetical protein [Candidatus Sororendozoicomonas aggregata]|uniref:hypothetical protein n=1 Tax=Candidatus Sororendozoicomonas aggregata TaxID=3073239 RepID=UPI002ED52F32
MGIKSVLRAGGLMTIKPVVFITGLLTLFIMTNAYSLNKNLDIANLISPDNPHYSKSGYTLKASGHGYCMYGVYNPASCTVTYDLKHFKVCHVVIHYAASLKDWCAFKQSTQDFNLINNDTGKIVASFQWYKANGGSPLIKNVKNPENIMANITDKPFFYWMENKVNVSAHSRGLIR